MVTQLLQSWTRRSKRSLCVGSYTPKRKGLPAGPYKVLIELINANHQTLGKLTSIDISSLLEEPSFSSEYSPEYNSARLRATLQRRGRPYHGKQQGDPSEVGGRVLVKIAGIENPPKQ
jgi:hypothetical protein